MWRIIILAVTMVAASPPAEARDRSQSAVSQERALPLKGQTVVDGDTLAVTVNGRRERLRLIGFDCGEVQRPRYKCEAELQAGRAGTERLQEQMTPAEGKTITVRRTSMRDGFGRPLTHAWVNGQHISKIMTSDGLCKPWDGEEARPSWC